MKCLLLAAGRGTRISRYLPNRPKCTIDIGGVSLIKYTVSLLKKYGVKEIALCVGYHEEVIREELEGLDCQFFYNPFFDVTNSIASAYLSRSFLNGDDFLIFNADVYLEEDLLVRLLKIKEELPDPYQTVMFMDSARIVDADYKFYCEKGFLKKYGKELSEKETTGEYIGAAFLKKEFLPTFTQKLEEMIHLQQHSVWWENVLYQLSETTPLPILDVKGNFWAEVDYIEDYERILKSRNVSVLAELERD